MEPWRNPVLTRHFWETSHPEPHEGAYYWQKWNKAKQLTWNFPRFESAVKNSIPHPVNYQKVLYISTSTSRVTQIY